MKLANLFGGIKLEMFGKKSTKEEKIRENVSKEEADLLCEEAIIEDKIRFEFVRTSLMKHLRAKYGRDVADRALRRVNKRRSLSYQKK